MKRDYSKIAEAIKNQGDDFNYVYGGVLDPSQVDFGRGFSPEIVDYKGNRIPNDADPWTVDYDGFGQPVLARVEYGDETPEEKETRHLKWMEKMYNDSEIVAEMKNRVKYAKENNIPLDAGDKRFVQYVEQREAAERKKTEKFFVEGLTVTGKWVNNHWECTAKDKHGNYQEDTVYVATYTDGSAIPKNALADLHAACEYHYAPPLKWRELTPGELSVVAEIASVGLADSVDKAAEEYVKFALDQLDPYDRAELGNSGDLEPLKVQALVWCFYQANPDLKKEDIKAIEDSLNDRIITANSLYAAKTIYMRGKSPLFNYKDAHKPAEKTAAEELRELEEMPTEDIRNLWQGTVQLAHKQRRTQPA